MNIGCETEAMIDSYSYRNNHIIVILCVGPAHNFRATDSPCTGLHVKLLIAGSFRLSLVIGFGVPTRILRQACEGGRVLWHFYDKWAYFQLWSLVGICLHKNAIMMMWHYSRSVVFIVLLCFTSGQFVQIYQRVKYSWSVDLYEENQSMRYYLETGKQCYLGGGRSSWHLFHFWPGKCLGNVLR